jgi:hypothetical protein
MHILDFLIKKNLFFQLKFFYNFRSSNPLIRGQALDTRNPISKQQLEALIYYRFFLLPQPALLSISCELVYILHLRRRECKRDTC